MPYRLLCRVLNRDRPSRLNEISLRIPRRAGSVFGHLEACSHLVTLEVTLHPSDIVEMRQLRQLLASTGNLRRLSVTGLRGNGNIARLVLCKPGTHLPRLVYLRLKRTKLCDVIDLRCLADTAWDGLEHLDAQVGTLRDLSAFITGIRLLVLSRETA